MATEQPHALPTAITLHRQAHQLEVTFDDGARFLLPCEYLRVYSPSAQVRGNLGAEAILQLDKQEVNITELRQVGTYALKIFFDDGHHTGLYTWDYLYRLGQHQATYWADYLTRLGAAGHTRIAPSWRQKKPPQERHRSHSKPRANSPIVANQGPAARRTGATAAFDPRSGQMPQASPGPLRPPLRGGTLRAPHQETTAHAPAVTRLAPAPAPVVDGLRGHALHGGR